MDAALLELMALDEALPRVLAFTRRFGHAHAELAMHAAVPLGLTPELMHLLRINFVPHAPFIAEADLLLSSLCREVGGGMYELDASVRALLLGELAQNFGRGRLLDLADFLVLHATRALQETVDPDLRAQLRAQQWIALAHGQPELAAEEIAAALREGVEAGDAPEVERIARLTGTLRVPLAGQRELIHYAAGLERLAEGNSEAANRLFATAGGPAREVSVGRVTLPAPVAAARRMGIAAPAEPAAASEAPQRAKVGDRPSYLFFLSYARSDADPFFNRFRQELAEAVRVKVGGPLEAVAFIDRDDIAVGQDWSEALSEALLTSRVLVPVYSRSYFASDYCGKEWAVFQQRQQLAAAATGGARPPPVILPVLWVGREDLPAPLPRVARDLQFHDAAAFSEEYAEVGLRYLMRPNRYRNAGREMIAALADRIVEVASQHHLPPLASKPVFEYVPSAFLDEPALAPAVDRTYLRPDLVFRKGSQGAPVAELQRDLQTLGYFHGAADSILGAQTEAAIRALQRDLLESEPLRDFNRGRVPGITGVADPGFLACVAEVVAARAAMEEPTGPESASPGTGGATGYRVAKVVVVGDPGAGKTALVGALTRGTGKAILTPTRTRPLWRLPPAKEAPGRDGELVFWDTKDDPLWPLEFDLQEAALILIAVEAHGTSREPAARWLQLVRSLDPHGAAPPVILVGTAADRYDHRDVDRTASELRELVSAEGLQGAVVTSAEEGRNVAELERRMAGAIDWVRVPGIESREAYNTIERVLPGTDSRSMLAIDREELLRRLEYRFPDRDEALRAAAAGLAVAQARDQVRALPSPNPVLADPNLFAALVRAMLEAMRSDAYGLPAAPEPTLRNGQFRNPVSGALNDVDRATVHALFGGIVDALLRSDRVSRVPVGEGVHLVAPSLLDAAEADDWDDRRNALLLGVRWAGPVDSAYVLLLVHLAYSSRFRELRVARHLSSFRLDDGQRAGIYAGSDPDGQAELKLLAEHGVPGEAAAGFADLVRERIPHCVPEGTALEFIEPEAEPELEQAETTQAQQRADTSRAPSTDAPLVLLVEQVHDGKQTRFDYRLHSEELGLNHVHHSSAPLADRGGGVEASLAAWVERIHDRLAALLQHAEDVDRLGRELRALGVRLGEELFGPDVSRTLWPLRSRIGTIQLISSEPNVPWELLRLHDPDTGAEDERFLCEYGLVRWIPAGRTGPPPAELHLQEWSYLAGADSHGRARPVGAAEVAWLTAELSSRGIRRRQIPPEVDAFLNALEHPNFDVLHIVCHAKSRQGEVPTLLLGDARGSKGEPRASEVGLPAVHQHARLEKQRPLVFLHAIESELGGEWADAFLRAGAGAFVGTAWPLDELPASRFVETFYDALLRGATLAEATTAARTESRKTGDASWLAYRVYGDPGARRERTAL
jgi:GTPase SAR1 family protein